MATSCAEDLLDRAGVVLGAGFEVVCTDVVVVAGVPVVLTVVDCVTGFGVAGCAGFLAILRVNRSSDRELFLGGQDCL